MLELDDIGMGTKGLMIMKEALESWSAKNKMVKGPIHDKFMCCRGLEICLRKAEYCFKQPSGETNIRQLLLV